MSGQKRSDTDEMTFAEHIDALRPHLVRGVLAILALAVAAFLCKGLLIDGVLFGPMSAGFPTNRLLVWMAGLAGIEFVPGIERMQLINTAMAGQFNLHLKISMVAAFCIGFPYLLALIAAGGVLYTLGAWFYARQGFRYHHMVWHLLINLAVAAHFTGIVFFLY